MVRGMLLALCIVFFGAVAGELQAPEIIERDIHGDYYQFREDGSICDHNGVVRGWVLGNRIYDTQWSPMYEMKEGRLQRVPDDMGG
jgi:hypothetical protein